MTLSIYIENPIFPDIISKEIWPYGKFMYDTLSIIEIYQATCTNFRLYIEFVQLHLLLDYFDNSFNILSKNIITDNWYENTWSYQECGDIIPLLEHIITKENLLFFDDETGKMIFDDDYLRYKTKKLLTGLQLCEKYKLDAHFSS